MRLSQLIFEITPPRASVRISRFFYRIQQDILAIQIPRKLK